MSSSTVSSSSQPTMPPPTSRLTPDDEEELDALLSRVVKRVGSESSEKFEQAVKKLRATTGIQLHLRGNAPEGCAQVVADLAAEAAKLRAEV